MTELRFDWVVFDFCLVAVKFEDDLATFVVCYTGEYQKFTLYITNCFILVELVRFIDTFDSTRHKDPKTVFIGPSILPT